MAFGGSLRACGSDEPSVSAKGASHAALRCQHSRDAAARGEGSIGRVEAPIVLYVVFWMVHLATVSCWYRRKLDGSAKRSSYITEVIFVRNVHSTDDLF